MAMSMYVSNVQLWMRFARQTTYNTSHPILYCNNDSIPRHPDRVEAMVSELEPTEAKTLFLSFSSYHTYVVRTYSPLTSTITQNAKRPRTINNDDVIRK